MFHSSQSSIGRERPSIRLDVPDSGAEVVEEELGDRAVNSQFVTRRKADLKTLWNSERPDLDYLVPGLIGTDEVCLLAGASGSGKTMVLIALAAAVATGRSPFNKFDPSEPKKVLYFDEEIGEYEFKRRLKRISSAHDMDSSVVFQNLVLFPQQGHGLASEDRIAEFHRIVRDEDPRLVILDTFISFFGDDENDNSLVRRWLGLVVSPLREQGRAVVVSHHLKKPNWKDTGPKLNGIRGASDIVNQPDKVWFLDKATKRGGSNAANPCVNLLFGTGKARRGDPVEPFVLSIEDVDDGGGIRVVHSLDGDALRSLPKNLAAKKKIRDALRRSPGPLELSRLLGMAESIGANPKTFRRAIDDLAAQGLIRVSKNGGRSQYVQLVLPGDASRRPSNGGSAG
jgi:hypothetical protein